MRDHGHSSARCLVAFLFDSRSTPAYIAVEQLSYRAVACTHPGAGSACSTEVFPTRRPSKILAKSSCLRWGETSS